MSKILCVFAHPDDEAFGPSGTIALLSQINEVYLVCVTNGAAGRNSSGKNYPLSKIRREELQKSAAVLGVKKVFLLGYRDGALCNNIYHQLVEDLKNYINKIKPDTLITFEQKGFLGHIDHIAVAMITSFIFEQTSFINKIMYFCITEKQRKLYQPYYIYIPRGYSLQEVHETYDVSKVWQKKISSMKQHVSQSHDFKRFTEVLNKLPKEEHFLIESKNRGKQQNRHSIPLY